VGAVVKADAVIGLAVTRDDALGLVVSGDAVIGIALTGASVRSSVGLEVTGAVGGSASVSALPIVNDSPTTPVISFTHGAAITFATSARTQKRTVS